MDGGITSGNSASTSDVSMESVRQVVELLNRLVKEGAKRECVVMTRRQWDAVRAQVPHDVRMPSPLPIDGIPPWRIGLSGIPVYVEDGPVSAGRMAWELAGLGWKVILITSEMFHSWKGGE